MNKLRLEAVIQRLDWQLEGRVPRTRRREIRNELRANLAAAAEEVGTAEAIRRLGSVRDLAAEYLEFETGRLRVRAGVYAAVATLALLELLGLAMLHGFREGFATAGGSGRWSYAWWPFAFEGDDRTWSASVSWLALIGLPLLAFLLWARAWRLLSRGRVSPLD